MQYLLPLFALAAPLVLLPIEKLLPYPYLIEELTKSLILQPSFDNPMKIRLQTTVLVGLLFALSENLLYLSDAMALGSLAEWGKRVLITTPFHIATCLIITISTLKGKKFLPLGILLAVLVHYAFNVLA